MLGALRYFIGNHFALERDRWVLWLPVGVGLGICIYFWLNWEPPLWYGLLISGFAAAGYWIHARSKYTGHPIFIFVTFAILTTAIGFTAAKIQTIRMDAIVLSREIGPTTVKGRIETIETYPKGIRIILSTPQISGLQPYQTPNRIRLRLRGKQPTIWPGDWINIHAKLAPPSPPASPGAFDFQRQAFFKGLGGVGFGLGSANIVATEKDTNRYELSYLIAKIRHKITDRIIKALPGPTGGVAAALMTGEKKAVDGKIVQDLRDAGLAHLLAISGLHVGLVAGIIFTGFRFLLALVPFIGLRYPIKKWAALAAIIGAFGYALIAGATLPTQRAFLMLSIALIAIIIDRRGISMRTLAWAALAVLLVQPESLLGPSFQMSFAAVMALISVYELVNRYRSRKIRSSERTAMPRWVKTIGYYIAGVGLTTLIAGLATAPYSAFHFNRFSDYGLAANLVAVPITALWVMPWAVISFVLMSVGAENIGLSLMGSGLDFVISVADNVSRWPGSVTLIPAAPTFAMIVISVGLIWLCLWQRRWRLWGLVAIVIGIFSATFSKAPDVLIGSKGQVIALKSIQGEWGVSNVSQAKYTRDLWLRRAGQKLMLKFGANSDLKHWNNGSLRSLNCDIAGCLYNIAQYKLAIAHSPATLKEDCWHADVVISLTPVHRYCPAPVVIDTFDLWRNGAHAIWITPQGIEVKTANGSRGNRPWVLKAKASTN